MGRGQMAAFGTLGMMIADTGPTEAEPAGKKVKDDPESNPC